VQGRYRIDCPRAGTRVWTPGGVVACEPLGAHMSDKAVSYLVEQGYVVTPVEEPTVVVEFEIPNESAIEQAQIAEQHREAAAQAAAATAIASQTVTVPIAASVKRGPGRPRTIIDNGVPMSGNEAIEVG